MRFITVVIMMWGCIWMYPLVGFAQTADFPSQLKRLEAYLNDQETFERKVRAFDKLHVALARIKRSEAKSMKDRGDREGARRVAGEARKHLKLVKDAYEMGIHRLHDSPVLHTFYGELLHDYFGDHAKALEQWETALRLDKTNARANNNMGMFLLHMGKYKEGLAHMDVALAMEPENPDWLFNMVQVYLTNFVQVMKLRGWDRTELYEEAMKLSARTVALSPSEYELLYDHAMNYFLADRFGVGADWSRAAEVWQSARKHTRIAIQRFECWLNEARVHLRAGNTGQARVCLQEADALMPGNELVKRLLNEAK